MFERLMSAACVVIVVAMVGYFGVWAVADANCKELGWREASVTWLLKAYCVARQDQTDIVVPLSEATRR